MQPHVIYSQRKWSFISMIALSIGVLASNIPAHSKLAPPEFVSWLTHATLEVAYKTPIIKFDTVVEPKMVIDTPTSVVDSKPVNSNSKLLDIEELKPLVSFLISKYELSEEEVCTILSSVIEYSDTYKVEPALILAIIRVESSFLLDAKSGSGARGLMQVMPNVHKTLVSKEGGDLDDLWEPSFNIKIGTMILKQMLRASSGNIENALARYNGSYVDGQENRYASKVLMARSFFYKYNKYLKTV